ncbi:MAG TPA: succinate dehydrogenase, hydrophobic membrane anchor protein [Gammaproteobacteria bacterium]|nr:succinate dehydrogenase, hydrophobic membrane anchor protein [Gammaproteobacteria bacterium]
MMNMNLRSDLGRVRGLGSAKGGTHHWWMQRLTAVALVPLCLWFVAAVVYLAGADYTSAAAWMRSPWHAALLLALIVTLFYHAQLGIQVVLEDYIHVEWVKVTAVVALRFAAILLGLMAALAVLRVYLGA